MTTEPIRPEPIRPDPGAPWPGPYEHTPTLDLTAHTAPFPTVFGAEVNATTVGDPLVGRLLDGRYQITQRLARGGMATVYQAVDTRLTRSVAVKVMHVGLGDDAEFARKFDREARAAARLSHPNVVSVFDQGQDTVDGLTTRPYIVMEYVDGLTLRDVINRDAPMPPLRALELIEPVLAALASAHDAGLVHRDVKPENVLISERGQLKVADFGLAKAISSQTSTATQGLLIGTVSYLPPELVVSGTADARSDVYSAGVVLFELLTGRKPHTGESPIQVAYAHVHTDVPAPSTFRTAGPIPPYLDALVAQATRRDPAARPHDARVFLSQVRRVRAALTAGLPDDQELTQDLSALPAGLQTHPTPRDRSDYEVTQLVGSIGPVAAPLTAPLTGQRPGTTGPGPGFARPQSMPSPPTVLYAPPPTVVRPLAPPPADRMEAARERRARKRRRGWLAFLLVLLLTMVAVLAGWYLLDGRFTSAPALSSLSKAEAADVAGKAGLQIHFDEQYSESVARGVVISTDPGAGTKVRKGSAIEAELSKGAERFPMPSVVGLTQPAAESAIQTASLEVGKVSLRYSDTVAAGIVLAASQSAGSSLKRDTAVGLTVSRGVKPIKITNYVGKPAGPAEAALTKAGFTVAEQTANSDTVPKDSVIGQDPKSGGGAKGDTITVVRSLGPVPVTVPNVTGMGIRAAQKVMSDAGFKTKVRAVAINYLGVGFVAYSSPRARRQAPKGSTITLYVV